MQPPVIPPVDPGWDLPSLSFIEWFFTFAWTVLAAIGAFLWRSFSGMQKRIALLEQDFKLVDHDLKGVRQNQVSLEMKTDLRHRENQQDTAELREFLTDELREIRRQGDAIGGRIDRLLERSGGA